MGEVVPGFHVLGSWHTPSYLWAGPKPVLFDAGMSFLGDLYVKHARRVLGERSPEILFLTHAHFDHCGAASTLRDAFPGLCIAASARAAEIVQRPGALELIRKLNEEARILAPVIEVDHPAPEGFRPFQVDTILADGDEIELGGGQVVRVLATPGHTRDFLSYYLPGPKVLVASEAVGCATISGDIGGKADVSNPSAIRVTAPGRMTLLFTPCSAPSSAATLDKPMRPALAIS